jgi:hypothetical protein
MPAKILAIASGNPLAWTVSALSFGEVNFGSAQELADNVLAKAGGNLIELLVVANHGNAGGIWLGRDFLGVGSFDRLAPQLGRLTPRFASPAGVFLCTCSAGKNVPLLRRLRDLWKADVVAGRDYHLAPINVNLSSYQTVRKNGTEEVTDFLPAWAHHQGFVKVADCAVVRMAPIAPIVREGARTIQSERQAFAASVKAGPAATVKHVAIRLVEHQVNMVPGVRVGRWIADTFFKR